MTADNVMLLNVVATLGGGAITLEDAVPPTLGSVAAVGGMSGWPAMMAVNCRMAVRPFNLALAVVGTVCPS
jgi:hypothetical protein